MIAFGQSRALLVWRRIVLPDGSSIQIDNLPATDAAGYAGLEDEADFHTWRLIKGVVLSTLLGASSTSGLSERLRSVAKTCLAASRSLLAKRSLEVVTIGSLFEIR